jgi:hypothetical protein
VRILFFGVNEKRKSGYLTDVDDFFDMRKNTLDFLCVGPAQSARSRMRARDQSAVAVVVVVDFLTIDNFIACNENYRPLMLKNLLD